MKAGLLIVLTTLSICLIPGCVASSLSDAQILESANQYAVARGLHPKDYDISVEHSTTGQDQASLPGGKPAPNFSQKVKSMTGSDTRTVTYTPKSRRHDGTYTFYINKNTGKLVMVMKRK